MGWEQALHSGFLCRRKDGRERKTASMNERWGGGGGGGGCWKLMWGGGGGSLHSQSQIPPVPLRGADGNNC